MIKIKDASIVLGDKQSTVSALSTRKFRIKEACATWGKILLLVAGTAIMGGLSLIKSSLILGLAILTGFVHLYNCARKTDGNSFAIKSKSMESTIIEALTAGVSAKTGVPITLSTARNYWRMVHNLFLKIHPGAEMKNMAWTKKWETVEPVLNSYAESTQVSVLNAICAVLRKIRGYKKVLKMVEAELARRVNRNRAAVTEEKDEKQKDYWMEWDEVLRVRDALPAGVDKVLLSLYTMMPPGRAAEYATMMVNEGDNCYDPDTGVMRIRKHKTSREFPDEVIEVPAPLKAVLTTWLGGRTSGSLLGLPSPGAITKRLNKIFAPKKISVSALRHLWDSHHHGAAVKALKKDAKAMRHSVGTAMGTYIKA